mgnify:CR=1 FL=1
MQCAIENALCTEQLIMFLFIVSLACSSIVRISFYNVLFTGNSIINAFLDNLPVPSFSKDIAEAAGFTTICRASGGRIISHLTTS